MLLESVLPTFTHMNQFLQRDEPLIHVLHSQITKLLKQILGKYLIPSVLAKFVADQKLADVNFKDIENQVNNDDLVIGIITKQLAHKLLDDRDITMKSAEGILYSCQSILHSSNRPPLKVVSFTG